MIELNWSEDLVAVLCALGNIILYIYECSTQKHRRWVGPHSSMLPPCPRTAVGWAGSIPPNAPIHYGGTFPPSLSAPLKRLPLDCRCLPFLPPQGNKLKGGVSCTSPPNFPIRHFFWIRKCQRKERRGVYCRRRRVTGG